MALLDQAGIYLILDGNTYSKDAWLISIVVNTPTDSLNRDDPADSYNAVYLQHVFATIDAFKSYDNLLGFFSGNEVINDVNTTGVFPPPSICSVDAIGIHVGQSNDSRYEGVHCKTISADYPSRVLSGRYSSKSTIARRVSQLWRCF